MKIKKLQIRNYKNLDANMVHNSDLIAFIGNNGSGKSNLLEAISIIFYYLITKKEKDIPFNFAIEYKIGGNKFVIIEKKGTSVTTKIGDMHKADIVEELPKQIVAIYSGEDDRLWKKCYASLYNDYIKSINISDNTGIGEYTQFPRMLFVNKYYWHISLLCLLLSDDRNIQLFCENILNVKKINSIKFVFNKTNYVNYSDSAVKNFIKAIDQRSEYTLAELKAIIRNYGCQIADVYKYLYIAFTPDKKKMVENIIINFNNENLEIEDLSEGEKKLLLINAALEYAGQEDSLFILDEPDAHVHVNNKEQIINCFKPYLHNRQIIITTHSPTVTECVKDENVYMLNNGKIEDQNKQEIIEEITGKFWNKHQQNSFLSSKKPIILLVEGAHDKEHISQAYEKLQDEYPDIKFDIFKLNSETNILPFMRGLYESDFVTDKIFIGIYDNDKTVNQKINRTDQFSEISGVVFKKIKKNQKENFSYFVCLLPKPEHIDCDCTIETLFDSSKFEEAYAKAFSNASGHFHNKAVAEIAADIKEQAKNILSDNSKTFEKEDFKHFRKLFNLIREIAEYSKTQKLPKDTAQPENKPPDATMPKSDSREGGNDNHQAFWLEFHKFLEDGKFSFHTQTPAPKNWTYISIGYTDFKLKLSRIIDEKTLLVQLVCRGANSLSNFNALKQKYKNESISKISPDIKWEENEGKKEHHVSLVLTAQDPFAREVWPAQFKLLSESAAKFIDFFKNKVKEYRS
jgi:ABC-type multidrug transport system ATPase subunit